MQERGNSNFNARIEQGKTLARLCTGENIFGSPNKEINHMLEKIVHV
jgi:hypothetical protein